MRYDENDKNSVPLKKASRILKFNESNYNSEDPEKSLFDENANLAHISFTPQGDRVFYTQCNYIEGTTKLTCAIYTKLKNNDLKYNYLMTNNTNSTKEIYLIGQNSTYYFYVENGNRNIKISPVISINALEIKSK